MSRRKNQPERSPMPLADSHVDRSRPWLLGAMTALLVARPLFPSESAAAFGDGMMIVMLWIALAVFWMLISLGKPAFTLRFEWIDAAVLLFIVWQTIASLHAVRHGAPRPAVNMLWEWIGMGIAFFLARQLIESNREARAVASVMISLAVALSAYGFYQYFYELPHTRALYEADPEATIREAGLNIPPDSPERKLFESRLENREPIATFALTNSLAAFLAPWLVVLTGIGAGCLHHRKRLTATVPVFITIAGCLALTKSRSGYIAAAVGFLLVWLVQKRQTWKPKWKILAAIAVILAIAVAGVALTKPGLLAQPVKSFTFRLHYWQATLQMIGEHPIFGCGPGNFQNAYTQYKLPQATEEIADPHNFLLEICSTAGIPALLAFLGVLAIFAWQWMRDRDRDHQQSAVASGQCSAGSDRQEKNSIRHALFILAGGILGFFLSVPVGMLSAAPQGIVALAIGIPSSIATMFLLRGWITDGCLPRWLAAVGVVVMLVDLSTTGGIAYPGIAGSFWLLIVLGMQGERPHDCRPWFGWIALTATVGIALGCYFTAYKPVLSCQAQLQLAMRSPSQTRKHLEAAAAADPLSAEPWRQLAAIAFADWQQHPSSDNLKQFEQANAKVLALAPRSAPSRLTTGDCYFFAYDKLINTDPKQAAVLLKEAQSAYLQAVQLYPNHTIYRAKLAVCHRAAGDKNGFRREAETALRLDDLTPDRNKGLPNALRADLLQGLDAEK